jgi:hypothetical protein
MRYAVEMDSGAMIYVHAKFHKDWFSHSGGHTYMHTDSMVITLAYVYFFKIRKGGL